MADSRSKKQIVHGSRNLRGQQARAAGVAGDAAVRARIIAVCREFDRLGLNQGTSGNISVRFDDGFLITPSAVASRDLRADMIVAMRLDCEQRPSHGGIRASSEWRLHRDILRARADAGAVVHCHAAHATALSMLGKPIPPAHYMIAAFGGADVRCAPYAPFGTQELSDLAVEALEGRTAALLGNHGAIVTGRDLEEAADRAQELETLARMYLLACSAGAPKILARQQIDDAVARFADYKTRSG